MKIKFLGTGAAEGIPVIGCECKHCAIASKENKSKRLRSCILLKNSDEFLLMDPGVDIRQQLLKYNINKINVILVTHEHYDHAYGLKDFKYWKENVGGNAKTILCAPQTLLNKISFLSEDAIQSGKLIIKPIKPYVFTRVGSFNIKPVRIIHTKHSFGYVIDAGNTKFVNLSDIASTNKNLIKKYTKHLLNSDYFVINTPFFIKPKKKHLGIFEAIELGKKLDSKHIILSHFNHYNKTHNELITSQRKTLLLTPYSHKILLMNKLFRI